MDITKITTNIEAATAALSSVSVAIPIALAAYGVLKDIWQKENPGKTEAEFILDLQTKSQLNIDGTAAYLTSQGYVQQPDGSWRKP